MRPASSIVLFTTLAGTAQGLLACLAIAVLAGVAPSRPMLLWAVAGAGVLLVLALLASFFHLGQKLRAWRAVFMWRTSWMSREVIVLPAFMAIVALWWLAVWRGDASPVWPVLVVVGAFLLWHCTAMIYACLRFVQEWAHPVTVVNYMLLGLSSGLFAAGGIAVAFAEPAFAQRLLGWTAAVTVLAALTRGWSLVRNARLKPVSTLQSATGVAAPQLRQRSMGMTGGSFNTREFFHGATLRALRQLKWGFLTFSFAVPLLLLVVAASGEARAWLLAAPLQYLGLLGERWFFFAQARHPQNLYYQVVS